MAKTQERVVRAAPRATAEAPFLTASAQLPLTGEDALRVNIVNRQLNAQIVLSGRYALAGSDTIHALADRFTPTSDGQESQHTVPVGAALLLNLHVRSSKVIMQPGECWARVEVVRGTGADSVLGVLLAGYIGSWGGLSWPGTPLRTPHDGTGYVHVEQDLGPAAGANPIVTMPLGARWRVIAAGAVLTTSAAAGTRRPYLRFRLNVGLGTVATVWQGPSSLPQPASTAVFHTWGAGMPGTADPNALIGLGSIPTGLQLMTLDDPDSAIDVNTVGIQAGDQWGVFSVLLEEWRHPSTKFT
jgi:hypothetical protein